MRKPILTALLAFSLPFSAHMTEYKIPNDVIVKSNLRMVLKSKVNEKLEYNVLSNIPVSPPIHSSKINRVSDLFGMRSCHPVLKVPAFHEGIDFSVDLGTPVLATANGVVIKVKYSRYGYGHHVIIKHDNNYCTLYAHLDDTHVTEGTLVMVGQEIGTVGNSGLSTGPHLHYGVYYDGHAIDPLSLYQINLEEEDLARTYLAFLSDFESVIDSNS